MIDEGELASLRRSALHKRDVLFLAAMLAVTAAMFAFSAYTSNRKAEEGAFRWVRTSEELPDLELPVWGVYDVDYGGGSVRREVKVVVRSIVYEREEVWLLYRPEAGPDLGRPIEWSALVAAQDVPVGSAGRLKYEDIRLYE